MYFVTKTTGSCLSINYQFQNLESKTAINRDLRATLGQLIEHIIKTKTKWSNICKRIPLHYTWLLQHTGMYDCKVGV